MGRAAHRAAGSSVTIEAIGDIDPSQWNDLISADRASSAFHSYEWLACMQATYPSWTVAAIVARTNQGVVAALPFVKRRASGVALVESLPFGGYGGVIRTSPKFDSSLLTGMFLSERRGPLSVVRLMETAPESAGTWKGSTRLRKTTVVDLSAGYEATAAKYRANVRKNLNRARHLGVQLQPVADQQSLEAFWRLAHYAYRLHSAVHPYPIELYESIVRLLVPARRATFELAYKDGEAVAGSLHLIGAHEMFNWLTPAYRESQELRANTLLIDHAIRYGISIGLQTYNLGGSEGDKGLERFKHSWGGGEVEYAATELVSGPVRVAFRARSLVRMLSAKAVNR